MSERKSWIPKELDEYMKKKIKKIHPRQVGNRTLSKKEYKEYIEDIKNAPIRTCYICGVSEFGKKLSDRRAHICDDCIKRNNKEI